MRPALLRETGKKGFDKKKDCTSNVGKNNIEIELNLVMMLPDLQKQRPQLFGCLIRRILTQLQFTKLAWRMIDMKVGSVVKIKQRTWDPLVDLVVENLQNPCKAELTTVEVTSIRTVET